jgi:hypothetical protein
MVSAPKTDYIVASVTYHFRCKRELRPSRAPLSAPPIRPDSTAIGRCGSLGSSIVNQRWVSAVRSGVMDGRETFLKAISRPSTVPGPCNLGYADRACKITARRVGNLPPESLEHRHPIE